MDMNLHDKQPNTWAIFISFVKIGALLIGGGYAMFPLLEDEIVKRRKWATSDEMTEFFTLAQILPGVIAINTAMLVGNRLRGLTGNIAAAAGTIFVPFLCIIAYAITYSGVSDFPIAHKILEGARPAVAGMIFALGVNMLAKSAKTHGSFAVAILSCAIVLFFNPNIIWLLLAAVIIGLSWHFISISRGVKND